eukprot:scaffold3648_cov92-Skeletonema_dohrnii-CCMP3373.AAC.2
MQSYEGVRTRYGSFGYNSDSHFLLDLSYQSNQSLASPDRDRKGDSSRGWLICLSHLELSFRFRVPGLFYARPNALHLLPVRLKPSRKGIP